MLRFMVMLIQREMWKQTKERIFGKYNVQALEIVREKYKEYAAVKREYPIIWNYMYKDVKKWLNEEWNSMY